MDNKSVKEPMNDPPTLYDNNQELLVVGKEWIISSKAGYMVVKGMRWHSSKCRGQTVAGCHPCIPAVVDLILSAST